MATFLIKGLKQHMVNLAHR